MLLFAFADYCFDLKLTERRFDCGDWKALARMLSELRELRGLRRLRGLRGLRGLRRLRGLRGLRDGERLRGPGIGAWSAKRAAERFLALAREK